MVLVLTFVACCETLELLLLRFHREEARLGQARQARGNSDAWQAPLASPTPTLDLRLYILCGPGW